MGNSWTRNCCAKKHTIHLHPNDDKCQRNFQKLNDKQLCVYSSEALLGLHGPLLQTHTHSCWDGGKFHPIQQKTSTSSWADKLEWKFSYANVHASMAASSRTWRSTLQPGFTSSVTINAFKLINRLFKTNSYGNTGNICCYTRLMERFLLLIKKKFTGPQSMMKDGS